MEDVTEAGNVALIGGQPFPRSNVPLRKRLLERIKAEGLTQVIEAMAYTWFNRIAAIRYIELPDNLLHSDSVIRQLVGGSEEADWEKVEVLGWLYQFYIS